MKRSYSNRRKILETRPFTVESVVVEEDGKSFSHPYHRLQCPDWVNVLPITESGKVLLIAQPRAGNEEIVLETPGGVCDTPLNNADAVLPFIEDAKRELEEETGYGEGHWTFLLSVNPNPATHANLLHLYLATNLKELGDKRTFFPDQDESIEVKEHTVSEVIEFAHTGKLNHALAVTCVLSALAKGYLDEWK